ncbi:hypothetical protein BS47DRAFT_1483996 [Hydnum rufescens UP504]|uniref:G domain-containing protein n=1 Tax=Hydnum rufescens UP504 TaxID=1448309 RepID=A0A9P6B2J7_9AGAM|nr:hypothetical protein BS47DRAFT_1483996 [Hydnum rufescens UP504]
MNTFTYIRSRPLSLSFSSLSTMWKSIREHFKLPKKPEKKVSDEQVPDEQVPDEQAPDEQVPDEQVPDEEVPDEEVTDKVPAKDRVRNNRFRILILGPANAGKTTLLERLTDSPAGAAIVTRKGQRIQQAPKGDDQRGIHNIDDEITYASNGDFVFHDSGGFEAGGVKEVEAVWKFIRDRSLASPSQQLHAVWLCIPTDNDRPFGFLRSGFFSEPTASVPVIGIFTKLDGREMKVLNEVVGPDPSQSDFLACARKVEQKVAEFVNRLETQFRNHRHPPAGFIRVRDMDKVSEQSVALCNQLLQATMGALPHETQRELLKLTVWKRNRRVHTIYVLERVLDSGAKGNIMTRIPGPGEDEETQLHTDSGFRILMVSDSVTCEQCTDCIICCNCANWL